MALFVPSGVNEGACVRNLPSAWSIADPINLDIPKRVSPIVDVQGRVQKLNRIVPDLERRIGPLPLAS